MPVKGFLSATIMLILPQRRFNSLCIQVKQCCSVLFATYEESAKHNTKKVVA